MMLIYFIGVSSIPHSTVRYPHLKAVGWQPASISTHGYEGVPTLRLHRLLHCSTSMSTSPSDGLSHPGRLVVDEPLANQKCSIDRNTFPGPRIPCQNQLSIQLERYQLPSDT